ncbi:MAG: response regulator [Chloroflexaceae bacterium]
MPTVLVIDDDPTVVLSIRLAVPDWTVLAAEHGLDGLDLLRRRLDEIDMIVLDITMPGLDGYWTCLQMRALSRTLPILPFTGVAEAVPFLQELGCAPVLLKPVQPDRLAEELHATLGMTPAPAVSAVLNFAQKQAAVVEQTARQNHAALRVGLLASARVISVGLRGLLTAAGAQVLLDANSALNLRRTLMHMRINLLVVAAGDYAEAAPIAAEYSLPMVVIASTLAEGLAISARIDETSPVGVLVITDELAPQALAKVLRTVVAGERYVPARLAAPFAGSPLSPQEQALLVLDLQESSTREIAQRLGVTPETVHHYRTRMCRKLDVAAPAELRHWAEQWWRGQPELVYS